MSNPRFPTEHELQKKSNQELAALIEFQLDEHLARKYAADELARGQLFDLLLAERNAYLLAHAQHHTTRSATLPAMEPKQNEQTLREKILAALEKFHSAFAKATEAAVKAAHQITEQVLTKHNIPVESRAAVRTAVASALDHRAMLDTARALAPRPAPSIPRPEVVPGIVLQMHEHTRPVVQAAVDRANEARLRADTDAEAHHFALAFTIRLAQTLTALGNPTHYFSDLMVNTRDLITNLAKTGVGLSNVMRNELVGFVAAPLHNMHFQFQPSRSPLDPVNPQLGANGGWRAPSPFRDPSTPW